MKLHLEFHRAQRTDSNISGLCAFVALLFLPRREARRLYKRGRQVEVLLQPSSVQGAWETQISQVDSSRGSCYPAIRCYPLSAFAVFFIPNLYTPWYCVLFSAYIYCFRRLLSSCTRVSNKGPLKNCPVQDIEDFAPLAVRSRCPQNSKQSRRELFFHQYRE